MKTARIAIFLTGMIGLGMGGLMSLSSIQSQQEEAVLRANENLKTQAQVYVDQFFGTIETVRSGGNPSYVLNQYSVLMNQGIPSEIEKGAKDNIAPDAAAAAAGAAIAGINKGAINNPSENIDLALEDRLIRALKNQVKLNDLQFKKYSVGTFEMSDLGSKEGLYVAIPSDVGPTKIINKLNVILIDPAIALATFSKLNSSKLDRNAYLISNTGKVLAHTSNAYVGTDLRKTEGIRESIENLFVGAQSGVIGSYHSVDGTKEQVAFVRAGSLPFAVGVEQRAIPAVLSIAWAEDQLSSGAARKALGMIFVVMAASLILFTAVSVTFNRRIQKEIKLSNFQSRFQSPKVENTNSETRIPNQSSVFAKLTDPNIQKANEAFTSSRNQIESETRTLNQASSALSPLKANSEPKIAVHRDYAEELSARVKEAAAPEAIERDLTRLTSEMSESPTLFFRYNRRLQNLTLGTVAGNLKVPNSALLQAYIRKDIEEQVEDFAKEGKVASLNNYGPVSKMMITHLNVAHYEAWAVTSEADVSETPKLVGVLVILNAGFRSAQSRPILSRMLREAGSYLYAQNNKVRSRSKTAPSIGVPINTDFELNS